MAVSLVTGGAGYLGSHLVAALAARGDWVRVLDDRGVRLPEAGRGPGRVDWIRGDLGNLRLVRRAIDGAETVFHLAAPVSRRMPPGGDPARYDDGALQVLIAARSSPVRRVVYASSLRVYGAAGWGPLAEDDPVCPVSAYAAAKLSGEQDCAAFAHLYGLETVRLRYANVFGPRQPPTACPDALAARLIAALAQFQCPVLPGDGLQAQDLLYVDDAVRAALLAAEAPHASGQVFNIGRGVPVTPLELAARLVALTGGPVPLTGGAPTPPELNNLADISRAETRLRFRPDTDLEGQLARCLEGLPVGPRDTRGPQRALNGR
jgi:UDP-glucose 4-epimerase